MSSARVLLVDDFGDNAGGAVVEGLLI